MWLQFLDRSIEVTLFQNGVCCIFVGLAFKADLMLMYARRAAWRESDQKLFFMGILAVDDSLDSYSCFNFILAVCLCVRLWIVSHSVCMCVCVHVYVC